MISPFLLWWTSVMVWPLLLPFLSFPALHPPSIHLQPHPTLSAHPLPPSVPTLRHTCATTLCPLSDWPWTSTRPAQTFPHQGVPFIYLSYIHLICLIFFHSQ